VAEGIRHVPLSSTGSMNPLIDAVFTAVRGSDA
jgi:hypothetical protein